MSGTPKCSALAPGICVDLPVKAAFYSWDASRELGPVQGSMGVTEFQLGLAHGAMEWTGPGFRVV